MCVFFSSTNNLPVLTILLTKICNIQIQKIKSDSQNKHATLRGCKILENGEQICQINNKLFNSLFQIYDSRQFSLQSSICQYTTILA